MAVEEASEAMGGADDTETLAEIGGGDNREANEDEIGVSPSNLPSPGRVSDKLRNKNILGCHIMGHGKYSYIILRTSRGKPDSLRILEDGRVVMVSMVPLHHILFMTKTRNSWLRVEWCDLECHRNHHRNCRCVSR